MLIVAGAGRLNREIGLSKSGVVGLVFALASIFPFHFLGHLDGNTGLGLLSNTRLGFHARCDRTL
jgi:hypothetical protein